MPDKPTASIIILTYNNLTYNRLCLESIFAKTHAPSYEVIVVDNASQDGTPEFLQALAAQHGNLRLVLNAENLGFAAGNNQGLAAAQGNYLVLLNNDTVVTDGWLAGLIRHLQDPAVGMVGPVTNAAGNESKIPVPYQALAEMDEFAAQYTRAHAGEARDISMLALFCAAMRRQVYAEIGPLDERFGFGMFEDDDYATRLKQAGYRLLCTEDVFVHHWGSATFSTASFDRYWRTYIENRQKYEDKWGQTWQVPRMREELLDEQLIIAMDTKLWLAQMVLDQKVYINDLLLELKEIKTSTTYRVMNLLVRGTARLAPEGSLRRRLLSGGVALVKSGLRLVRDTLVRLRSAPQRRRERALRVTAETEVPVQLANLLEAHSPEQPVILLAPTVRWNVSLFQRPQQLAIALARQGNLVIFCDPVDARDFPPGLQRIEERLYVLSQVPLELIKPVPSPVVLTLAYNRYFLEYVTRPRVVYEYIDDLQVFPGNPAELKQTHHELVASAEVVVATADLLYQELLPERPDALLLPNAVDYDFIRQTIAETLTPPDELAPFVQQGKPVIGYYGALAKWFNYNLVIYSAQARPDYEFVLIGPEYDNSVTALKDRRPPNLHWLGPKNYTVLPRYLKYFSVATIPFRLNEITHATSPLKLFEYMSAGKPIVTTAMRECARYPEVLIAQDEAEFLSQVDRALQLRSDPEFLERLDRVARANTWEGRAQALLQVLAEKEPRALANP